MEHYTKGDFLQKSTLQREGTMKSLRENSLSKIFWVALILPLAALACQVVASPNQLVPSVSPTVLPPTIVAPVQPQVTIPQAIVDEQSLLIALYKQVNPSVVNITVYTQQGNEGLLPLGQASGFVYDQAGNIITNAHVVSGADQIEVRFSDGSVREAELTGKDLNSDLAVVKVANLPAGIQPIPLGDMENVAVGQTVVAIGNPFGLEGTLTRGIVSAIGRTIPTLTQFRIPKAIQTDAPINPGNSGGPLLNLEGKVIGVNAQIETDGQSQANSGIGFAIPVSIINRVVPELISKGDYNWAWLGVRGTDLTQIIAQAMKLPIEKGAYITDIIEGGPAAKAGLQGANDTQTVMGHPVPIGGDIITAINGLPINTFDDLLIYIALETMPNQTVTLTILRDGQPQEFQLKLEPRPTSVISEPAPQTP
jgi:S1-C subfamily serine protease